MNNDLYIQKAQAKLNEYQAIIQQCKEKAKLKAIQSKVDITNQLAGAQVTLDAAREQLTGLAESAQQGTLDAAKQQLSGLAESAQDKSKEVIANVGAAVDNLTGLAESAQDKSKEMIANVGVAVDNLTEKFNKIIFGGGGDDDETKN